MQVIQITKKQSDTDFYIIELFIIKMMMDKFFLFEHIKILININNNFY